MKALGRRTLLLVGDDSEIIETAEIYSGEYNVRIEHAVDYLSFKKLLDEESPEGVISPLCFAYKRGSGDIHYGKRAVVKMLNSDPREQRLRSMMKRLGEVALIDSELSRMLRNFAYNTHETGVCPPEVPITERIVYFGESVKNSMGGEEGRRYTADITKRVLRVLGRMIEENGECGGCYRDKGECRSCYIELWEDMKRDEGRQPLSIMLGEELEGKKIPFIYNIKEWGPQRRIWEYCRNRGWRVVEYPNPFSREEMTLFLKGIYDELFEGGFTYLGQI